MLAVQAAIEYGSVFAFGLAALIFAIVRYLIPKDPARPQERLRRLLRDSDGLPSLSRFQFFAWTVVIIFCFGWVYFIRLTNGVLVAPSMIPANLLAVMGISAAAAVAGPAVSGLTSYQENLKATLAAGGTNSKYAASLGPDSWRRMFLEQGEPSLGRVQMFAWTVLALAIYAVLFAITLANLWNATSAVTLQIPDVDASLLVLMGISQVGYVGTKVAIGTATKSTSSTVGPAGAPPAGAQ